MNGTTRDRTQRLSKPPDGGWGWMIVVAYGLANIMIVPVLQSFGLIFRDTFKEINISATKASVIINLASAVGMALGLFNGPLLRKYGFRKLAVAGGFLFSAGLMLTSSATYFAHFIITYSIIASLGMGFCNSSFSLALNTYFKVRRNKAAGIAMTITGLGPIMLPQFVSLLLGLYGPRNCLLIIGALATHIIAAALLLQPIKWHVLQVERSNDSATAAMALPPSIEVIVPKEQEHSNGVPVNLGEEEEFLEKRSDRFINHDVDTQSIYGFELTSQLRQRESFSVPRATPMPRAKSEVLPLPVLRCPSETRSLQNETCERPLRWFQSGSTESVHLGSSLGIWEEQRGNVEAGTIQQPPRTTPSQRRFSSFINVRFSPLQKRWFEGSADTVHLGSSMKIFDGPLARSGSLASGATLGMEGSQIGGMNRLPALSENQGLTDESTHLPTIMRQLENTKPSPLTAPSDGGPTALSAKHDSFAKKLIHFFDLTLLRDKVYLNMMLGMSIAVFAEINFSLLTPFILGDLGYGTLQIASIMSTLAVADLLFRFISPFVGDCLKLSPRTMYMFALTLLIVFRFSILLARDYREMMYVAVGLGIAKGVRSVYMSLVIPSYIPLERLPSASSIQMTTNGIILMTIGPCVGALRDWTGSYAKSIILINAFTIVTLLMWTAELVYVRRCNRKRSPPATETPKVFISS